jgi:hypothetical protein
VVNKLRILQRNQVVCARLLIENFVGFLAIRHVFADVRGFSFVEGIAWQLFVAGGLRLRMKIK